MKELKETYVHKEILRNSLDMCFWEVMNARIYFINELLLSDYMNYALDMASDSTDLSLLLDTSADNYVHPYIARKISVYYQSVQELMFDIKAYLLNEYNIDYNKELEHRKAKRNAKKKEKIKNEIL